MADSDDELTPVQKAVGRANYTLDKHKKYKSDKYLSERDNVIDGEKPLERKTVEMPGDFKSNTQKTPLGENILGSKYKPAEMAPKSFSEDASRIIKEKQKDRYYKQGGKVRTASQRADGIAIRGKTRA
jgi:hypothetical protein